MIGEWIDSFAAAVSPAWGAKRVAARYSYDRVRRSYDAGKVDRLVKSWGANQESGESPNVGEMQRAKARAWDLYRNNSYARKCCNAVIAQVIGTGIKPESLATKSDGSPDSEFRTKAKELWKLWCKDPMRYGKTGMGGHSFDRCSIMILLELILTGEAFVRLIEEPPASERVVPFSIDVIAAERVPDDSSTCNYPVEAGNFIYRGIEFRENGERVAYYVNKFHPNDPRPVDKTRTFERVPAEQILHIYLADRVDQIRGVSWFAPLLLQLKDIKDYQENEMVSAAIAACFSVMITNGSGAAFNGLQTPANSDVTDADGNTISRLQPGMIMNAPAGSSVTPVAPGRPNSSAEPFINHLLRSLAGGLFGVKSSTITMDYRASSFSSERSADNDAWRETEQVQVWLSEILHQNLWSRVITRGIEKGFFKDVLDGRSFKQDKFDLERHRYLAADWNGPVAKSINPTDDAQAAIMLIKEGLSSLPVECANIGTNWEENLDATEKVNAVKTAKGIPVPELIEAAKAEAEINAMNAKTFVSLNPPPQTNGVAKRNWFVGHNGEDLSRGI